MTLKGGEKNIDFGFKIADKWWINGILCCSFIALKVKVWIRVTVLITAANSILKKLITWLLDS